MMDQALQNYCFGGGDENSAVTAVLVAPLADNEKAIRFYQKCGFRPWAFDSLDPIVALYTGSNDRTTTIIGEIVKLHGRTDVFKIVFRTILY
jgi:RimJ/RimL family protein N-acetyltransferase